MRIVVIEMPHRVKVRLRRLRRQTRDKGLAIRCQIVLQAAKGRSSQRIAEGLGCSRSWVSRVIERFREYGEAGLLDRREDNGELKVDSDESEDRARLDEPGPATRSGHARAK